MDKGRKEITIDFDMYVAEKKQAFTQGTNHGYESAFKAIVYFISNDVTIDKILKGKKYSPIWGELMVALGRKAEWDAFVDLEQKNSVDSKLKDYEENVRKLESRVFEDEGTKKEGDSNE